jgi:hypothetical protein
MFAYKFGLKTLIKNVKISSVDTKMIGPSYWNHFYPIISRDVITFVTINLVRTVLP